MFVMRRVKSLIGKLPKVKFERTCESVTPDTGYEKIRKVHAPFQESEWLKGYYNIMSKWDSAKFPEVSIEGQPISLYRLFLCVTDKGGFESVDRWDIIAMILDVKVRPERLRSFYENHLLPYEWDKNFKKCNNLNENHHVKKE